MLNTSSVITYSTPTSFASAPCHTKNGKRSWLSIETDSGKSANVSIENGALAEIFAESRGVIVINVLVLCVSFGKSETAEMKFEIVDWVKRLNDS